MKSCLVWVLLLFIVITALLYRETKLPVMTVTEVGIKNDAAEAVCIMQISDLHGSLFGIDQSYIRRVIGSNVPDFIVLTGDMVDTTTTNLSPISALLQILPEAPVFFVPGNHDISSPLYEDLLGVLVSHGVEILINKQVVFEKGNHKIRIIGIDDPHVGFPDLSLLDQYEQENHTATLLLAHSPTFAKKRLWQGPGDTLLDTVQTKHVDLILCGHTHGGQINLPYIGAVIVPGQSFPPTYVRGVYTKGNITMYITAGLGTSRIPLRIMCRPEVSWIEWYP